MDTETAYENLANAIVLLAEKRKNENEREAGY
jgi:hypothetical protein